MPAIELSPAERKAQRAAAHHLHPVAMIGAGGLTDAVVREVDAALAAPFAAAAAAPPVFTPEPGPDSMPAGLDLDLDFSALPTSPVETTRPLPPKADAEPAARGAGGRGPRVMKVVKFSKSGNHRATVKTRRVLGNERLTAAGKLKRREPRRASVKKKPA